MLIDRELVEHASNKTVIVLDKSPNFAAPATQSVSIQIKDEQGAQMGSQLKKTLWNCSVESSLEFHRIVTDLFPRGTKQLRFVVSDFAGRYLTPPWKNELIRYEELLKSIACDIAQTSGGASSCSIINGISMAVEAISEKTPLQQSAFQEQQKGIAENEIQDSVVDGTDYSQEFANRGTIVVLTSIDSSEDYNSINESITEQITMRNDSVKLSGNQNFLVIDKVKLIVVNVLNAESCNDPKYSCLSGIKTSSILDSCLISVPAGPQLVSTMHKVLQDVYDLISTTVSGVPMKEDAQQDQSVNYDVELLHHRNAHSQLAALGFLATDSKIFNKAESGMYNTTRLKWCTAGPKLKSDKFPLLQSSCLFTPAYVNSRPTVCLTSFVQSGKCVMLEVDQSSTPKGQQIDPNMKEKLISHYLSKDEITGGLIIQCVAMGDRASATRFKSQLLPNDVLLDVLKCMRRIGLAKIQDTAQLVNGIIKRDFASKPLHIFDDTARLRIRRNEKNEMLVGFYRERTDSTDNMKCFVPNKPELEDCETEEECWHCYPIDEMRPFLANYIRYARVGIEIDNVDNSLPPYTPEQITVFESICHIWTGQMLRISDYFENSIDHNLKGMLGSSAILQCHSLKLYKSAIEDETMSGIITDLQECAYLYTIPVIYFSCPILENDILRLIRYKAAYPQSDTTLVLYDGYIEEDYDDWLDAVLDALDTIKEEFSRSSVPCRLRVIIEIDLCGSTSIALYDSIASSESDSFQFRLENSRTKEVLQLKQITAQEAKEKFNVLLEEKPDEEAEDFEDDAQNDSLPEVTDKKALILERFTA